MIDKLKAGDLARAATDLIALPKLKLKQIKEGQVVLILKKYKSESNFDYVDVFTNDQVQSTFEEYFKKM